MKNYEREIQELHQFFEDYLSGRIEPDPITRFEHVLDDGFTIVSDEGAVMKRDDILGYVRNGHNQRPSFSIWTENVSLKQHLSGILLVTYEEWQTIDDVTTSRTSSVAFKEDDTMPNGLVWLHVHESGLKTVE